MIIPLNRNEPKVSIGLPVFNGENYLREALDSLLSQTYTDFELIISDNASTDTTQAICEDYAFQDKRIYYHRCETNIGAAANYNKVFGLARGEYFKWAAHDDVCSSEYINGCVKELDEDSSITLCYSKEIAIDECGRIIPGYMSKYERITRNLSNSPSNRLLDLCCKKHGCYQIFGLVRRSILKKTGLIGSYVGADRVLLAELAMLGKFWESKNPIYYRRHPNQYCALKNSREREAWYSADSPSTVDDDSYILSRQFKEYILSIKRVEITFYERLKCYRVMLVWLFKKRKRLKRELLPHLKQWLTTRFSSNPQAFNKNG